VGVREPSDRSNRHRGPPGRGLGGGVDNTRPAGHYRREENFSPPPLDFVSLLTINRWNRGVLLWRPDAHQPLSTLTGRKSVTLALCRDPGFGAVPWEPTVRSDPLYRSRRILKKFSQNGSHWWCGEGPAPQTPPSCRSRRRWYITGPTTNAAAGWAGPRGEDTGARRGPGPIYEAED